MILPPLPICASCDARQPGGVLPSPRPALCSEDGCIAPATCRAYVPVMDNRGESCVSVAMPFCADCAGLPGLEIIGKETT